MNLNTSSVFRRHSKPIVAIFLFLTVLTITIYKYENEALNFYNQATSGTIDKLTNILEEMVEEKMKKDGPCSVPRLVNLNDFFDYGKREKYKCKNLVEVGGNKRDGSKFVCFDNLTPGKCNVFSFGINNEWSFDDAIYKFGCIVYAFDPTMGKEDFDRTPGIHFFNLGLSDFKGELLLRKKKRKVDRYVNILEMLNLTSTPIDYLKMDIESSEINFFLDVLNHNPHLLDNVKQMGIEIHPGVASLSTKWPNNGKNKFNIFWSIMHRLECRGFKLLHYEANRVKSNHYKYGNRTESGCYEIVWIHD